ncbi:hypothetical protein HQQ80_10600 [Microbacteriaceae bacterium VKM Ac-2855]|nr:hypothetical protein [Microbacteriaceae bacterium VKM Ac-2855]
MSEPGRAKIRARRIDDRDTAGLVRQGIRIAIAGKVVAGGPRALEPGGF